MSAPTVNPSPERGLSSEEAQRRLARYGRNAVAEPKEHPLIRFLGKLWAPIPWMLEATIALELALGRGTEAVVIGFLLVFNSALSFFQEGRAHSALKLLRKRLTVRARVMRDGSWAAIDAEELVPGDLIYVRAGDVVPADATVSEGGVLLDQSALTGESLPVEAGPGHALYASSVVKRGEAGGEVTATGSHTYFGRTAQLVSAATTASHLGEVIFAIVKYLVALDTVLVAAMLIYAFYARMPAADALPFGLILLVASVPVALPATFTLATTLGALELTRSGVLITRLSAIEEAAAMDVLCVDKTGTITENRLTLGALVPLAEASEAQLLELAALASDEATQDPIDLAILSNARAHGLALVAPRLAFTPFDPATKRSEASILKDGQRWRVVKGAPRMVAGLSQPMLELEARIAALAAQGQRVLAVAAGPENDLRLIGLLGLHDPPRPDSRELIGGLAALGVRVVMVTGDDEATARAIAAQVGIGTRVAPAQLLREPKPASFDRHDVFAGVFPEDKFALVRLFQAGGHVCGMTGDGVNDAPALQQAEVGIAVAQSTDVARAAASIVLTAAGLTNVIAAVKVSRRIYQRMLTYTLNKIIKTLEIAIFLSVGVMLTGVFVITPLLIVLLLFTNDFVTMSIASDSVSFSTKPDRWRIGNLLLNGAAIAAPILMLSFTVFFVARGRLHLPLPQLQTLIFLMLVFSGQGTVYLVRERDHFWRSRPGPWLIAASLADIAAVSALAIGGILMAPIAPVLVIGLLLVVAGYLVLVDFLKVRIFKALALR